MIIPAGREGDGCDDYFPKWSMLIILCYFVRSSLLRNQASSSDPSLLSDIVVCCISRILYLLLDNHVKRELRLAFGIHQVVHFSLWCLGLQWALISWAGGRGKYWWCPQMIDSVFSVLTHKFLFAEGSNQYCWSFFLLEKLIFLDRFVSVLDLPNFLINVSDCNGWTMGRWNNSSSTNWFDFLWNSFHMQHSQLHYNFFSRLI